MNTTIIFTIVTLVALGLIFSVVLYLVAQKFKVDEDPRIDIIEGILPGANCGGCGNAGCRAFAEGVVKAPDMSSFFCPVGGNEVMAKIAKALGQEVAVKEPMVAVVRCNGTCDNRPKTNTFDGYASCKVMASLYSGDTGCRYGCLGCGDCVKACPFDAIHINEGGIAEVDQDKCTACGTCVKTCPKSIIELRKKGPRNMRVFVACANKDKGAVTRKSCGTGCIGCGKCVKVCAQDAITLENNLAYIDYTKCKLCKKCVDECPVHAIHAVNFPIIKKAPAPAVASEQKSTENKEA